MNNPVLETLFYPFSSGGIDGAGQRCLFWGARNCAELREVQFASAACVQFFKPYVAGLEAAGFDALEGVPEGDFFDVALVVMPQNMIEAHFAVASVLRALADGGLIVIAAGNKAGGGRIVKMLESFGVFALQQDTRNKCRVVWGVAERLDMGAIDAAISDGSVQDVQRHGYKTQPGVFGWDKIDKGSELLAKYSPDYYQGRGADFGCGYGYLSAFVMDVNNGGVDEFYAIDADVRAVRMTSINAPDAKVIWDDIVTSQALPKGLDFIVMNPPFHEGKRTDADIGVRFIEQAAPSLCAGGVLWMVANTQLPYERVLEGAFSKVEKLGQENGFKVFRAVR